MSELVELWVMKGDRKIQARWGSAKTGAFSPFGFGKQSEGWLFDEPVSTDVFRGLTRAGAEITFPGPYKHTSMLPGDVLAVTMRVAN